MKSNGKSAFMTPFKCRLQFALPFVEMSHLAGTMGRMRNICAEALQLWWLMNVGAGAVGAWIAACRSLSPSESEGIGMQNKKRNFANESLSMRRVGCQWHRSICKTPQSMQRVASWQKRWAAASKAYPTAKYASGISKWLSAEQAIRNEERINQQQNRKTRKQ